MNVRDLATNALRRVTFDDAPDSQKIYYREGGRLTREVVVRPVNLNTEAGLLYRAWAKSRRAYVARASGGALGHVNMPDMSAESLDQLYLDLDAENQARKGVVVDGCRRRS